MKMFFSLTLSVFIFLQNANAIEFYKKAPSLQSYELLKGKETPQKDIHIIYFWATWCAPCAISTKDLKKFITDNPSRVSVIALSSEEKNTIKEHLKKSQESLLFPYAHIEASLKKTHPYFSEVTYLPFTFVIYKANLIWAGNPTYPKKEFTNLINELIAGTWTPEASKDKKNKLLLTNKKIAELESKKKTIAKELSTLNKKIISNYNSLIKYKSPDFMEFSGVFWTLNESYGVDSLIVSSKEAHKTLDQYRSEIKSHILKYIDLLKDSKDDLIYMAADIFAVEDEGLQFFNLGHQVLSKIHKLSKQEATYPDYLKLIEAQSAFRKGHFTLAKKKAVEAVNLSNKLKRPEYFKRRLRKTANKINSHSLRDCYSFFSCLKSAFK